MPLTTAQSAAKTYLTTSQDQYFDPGNNATKAVSEWYTLGADNVVVTLMNDLAFGTSLGRKASVDTLEASDIKKAIGDSASFDTMKAAPGVIGSVDWFIKENPVPRKLFTTISVKALGVAYPAAKAAFDKLTIGPATVWQNINDDTGVPPFSQADMNAIRAS